MRIGILIFLSSVILISYNSAEGGERKVIKLLEKNNIKISNEFIKFKDGKIRVVISGNKEGRPLLLVHGSPGDWSAWENIILDSVIQSRFKIIAIDRPGYGETTVKAEKTLKEQAKAVRAVIDSLHLKNTTVVCHSYGGGVTEQLLVDNSEDIEYAIFVAPTLSPKLQEPKWYNKVGRRVTFMLPKDLKSSNCEMYPLANCLRENENKISNITVPITFIQGKKDWLVPFETVSYFKEHQPNEVKYIIDEQESHFILWSKPELIIKEIHTL